MSGIPVFPEGSFQGWLGGTRWLLLIGSLVALNACASSGGYVSDGSAQALIPTGGNGGTGGTGEGAGGNGSAPDAGDPIDSMVAPPMMDAGDGGRGGTAPPTDGSTQDRSGGMDSQQPDSGGGVDSQPVDMGAADRVSVDTGGTDAGSVDTAPPPMNCGNGRIDTGEDCDGTNMNGRSCQTLGFTGGTLSCAVASCLFNLAACTAATTAPKINISASRTVCAAPCAVFFDATGSTGLSGATSMLSSGDYVNASFRWSFSDPNSRHPTAIGFAAAHVFDSPGTYQVSVDAIDAAGVAAPSANVQVTVSAMSGSTFYVATNGNDANPGTITQPFATVAKGVSKAATNTSILFRRGDKFSSVTKLLLNALTGPVLFGSYSDTASPSSTPPVFTFVSTETNPVQIDSGSDIRFIDLHFVDTSNGGTLVTLGGSKGPITNTLVERVEIEGDVTGAYFSPATDGSFFFDDHIHKNTEYGMYGSGALRGAIVGTTIEDYGIYHGIRLQGCQETGNTNGTCSDGGKKANLSYVAENVVSDAGAAFDAVQFRGDNNNIVFVRNTVNRNVGINPQNNIALEYESNALVEGNVFYDPRDAHVAQFHALTITAKHVAVRNNVFIKASVAVSVLNQPLIPVGWVDEVTVYNNVSYYPPGAESSGSFDNPRFAGNSTPGSMILKNNIFRTDQASSNFGPSTLLDGTGTEDYNLTYAPNNSSFVRPGGTHDVYGDPGMMSIDPTNANAFKLSKDSKIAIDVGTPVPAYRDFTGMVTRPQGTAFDLGAFEFVP